jgi:hypothetical protein
VDVPDRRRGQRAALVPAALLGALVRALGPVLDPRPAAAARATPAQLGVERVQGLGVELADPQVPEARRDVVADVGPVQLQRVRGAVELVQVAGQELVDGRGRPRVPLLLDLPEESGQDRLSLPAGFRAGRDDLHEVVALPRDGIDPGVHPYPE